MDYVTAVREAAGTLQLLDSDGSLKKLDSLTIIDLVMELENVTKMEIPTVEMRPESFESIQTIADMLREMAEDR